MTKDWYERALFDKQCEIERLRGEIIVLGHNELYLRDMVARAADALSSARPDFPVLVQELREAAR